MLCAYQSLPTGGNKQNLISSILSAAEKYSEENPSDIRNVFIKSWFFKPFSTDATKSGSLNEENVMKALTKFLEDFGDINVIETKEFGLLQNKLFGFLCTSPDGIMLYDENNKL